MGLHLPPSVSTLSAAVKRSFSLTHRPLKMKVLAIAVLLMAVVAVSQAGFYGIGAALHHPFGYGGLYGGIYNPLSLGFGGYFGAGLGISPLIGHYGSVLGGGYGGYAGY